MASASAANASNPYASASLYVGDLKTDVTEATLFEVFNAVGPVASIRVCRDSVTRRSLGYAYVNFHSVDDAERALDTMNFSDIKGQPCRIMWSQRDPLLRRSGKGNIFVKNLHESIDNKTLYDTFSVFGDILSCKVVIDRKTGKSRGYGYVHYVDPKSAQKAIKGVDGMKISDRVVLAEPFKPREERQNNASFTNVYVKYIPKGVNEEQLKTLFEKETDGKITSSKFWSHEFGTCACFNFEKPEQAKAAIDKLNGRVLDEAKKEYEEEKENNNKKKSEQENENENNEKNDNEDQNKGPKGLYVARCQKQKERTRILSKQRRGKKVIPQRGVNLYVKNLADDIDDDKLKSLFEQFGKITSAKVMTDNGKSRNFGFVCFKTPEAAARALYSMHGQIIQNKSLCVFKAQKKEQRRVFLARKRNQYRQQIFWPYGAQGGQQRMGGPGLQGGAFGVQGPMGNVQGGPPAAVGPYGFGPSMGMSGVNPNQLPINPNLSGMQNPNQAFTNPNLVRGGPQGMGGPMSGMQQGGIQSGYGNIQNPQQAAAMANLQNIPPQQRQMYLQQLQAQGVQMGNLSQSGAMGMQQQNRGNLPMGGFVAQQANTQIPQFVQNQQMQRPNQYTSSAQNLPANFPRQPQQGFAPNVSSAQNVAPQLTGAAPSGPNTSVQQHSVSAVSGANVHHSASMQETQPLTSAMLQNAKPEERKRFIGERLFPKIQAVEPRRAGKITGMLLEMDDTELLVLLHDNNALFNKINEALAVLKDHQIKQSAQNPSQQNASQQNASQLNNPRLSASNQQTSQSQTHQA